MKKIFALLLAAALVFTLAACAAPEAAPDPEPAPAEEAPADDPDPEPEDVDEAPEEPEEAGDADAGHMRVALVAHSPDSILDDGSFNQGAWDGIQRFLTSHGLSGDHAQFFQPHEADDESRLDLVAQAISEFGATVIVLPGFDFATSSTMMQEAFPDVHFILLDTSPRTPDFEPADILSNLVAVHYAEEQAGFLAGYAAVMEGYTELGFVGGRAVPAVVRFGHGFLQGAEHAGESLGLGAGDITINHYYVGGFAPDPGVATLASAWYADGIEVIFAAAGGAGFSVMSGAEASGGAVIGVDVDQSGDSDTVITSAIKALNVSVYDLLTDVLNGQFRGGVEVIFDAAVNGIGLTMDTARFENFTAAQYEAIFALLADGTIVVDAVITETPTEAGLDLSVVNLVDLN